MNSKRRLGDIAQIIMGQSPSGDSCNAQGYGTPLLNGPTEFGPTHPYPVQYTTDPKKMAQPGDLLFCVRGSTTGRMNWSDRDYAIGRGIAAIRGIGRYPNSFVRAVIETNIDDLLQKATGSTFPNVSRDLLSEIHLNQIGEVEAISIASALEPIDDRITLLRETNATLEAIAQAIFKSWFIDFEPVRAKQEGRIPEGIDEETAALFPDSFEESELGMIPRGWQTEQLTEVFDFLEGPGLRNWQYTNSDVGTRFINIRCIQDNDLDLRAANRITDSEANGKYSHFHLKAWDVVVSTSGTLGRTAIVRNAHLPLVLNTSVIRFRPLQSKMGFCFLYEYLKSPEFLYKLESMASGSVQKNFGPMHLRRIKLVCPSFKLITCYESLCQPLFERVIENRYLLGPVHSI